MSSTPHFIIPGLGLEEPAITLPEAVGRQIARVLRMKLGERIVLGDGAGRAVLAQLAAVEPKRVVAEPIAPWVRAAEPACRLLLVMGLLRAEKLALVLQKATELGVGAIWPVRCTRCVATTEGGGRHARWEAIVREAAEQSGRLALPEVLPPVAWHTALPAIAQTGMALVPWEEERGLGLARALAGSRATAPAPAARYDVAICIGPEGGLTAEEVAAARAHGIVPVTLGPRILRAETAAIVATTLALAQWGDLG